ncbi:MAG: spore coat protein [Treponema sp.]|nr:spore coat protein [Treponema sp.]
MTGIVLQARLDSSRLPKKALLPLDGEPLVLRVMEALNHTIADLRILACPKDSFSVFKPLAEQAGFHILAGSKEDVLERFCDVIRHFSLTRVIRATGDNPFVFTDAASMINREAIDINADYAGYTSLPYGAGVEAVSASALLGAVTAQPYEREHVCPVLYNNPEKYRLHRPLAPIKWQNPDIRLTVDTREDYEKAKLLYNALKNDHDRFLGAAIINKYKQLNHGG